MITVNVHLAPSAERSYPIYIGADLLDSAAELAGVPRGKVFVISDSNVAPLYGGLVARAFKKAGCEAQLVIFPAGEASKSRREKERLEDVLFTGGAGRDALICAVGGGVAGDLAGFVAATFMRGVAFINVPTTLLAAVDAAVGGKTGIDTPYGKNLLGAFWQPQCVIIDVAVFASLPRREIRNGLAEMVKHGMIGDAGLFELLEKSGGAAAATDRQLAAELVRRNCELKARIVAADEREADLRQVLNYGHTIGHALERLANYGMPHGEAVACGMAAEGEIAVRLGLLARSDLQRQNRLLEKLGLPLKPGEAVPPEELLAAAATDKKNRAGSLRFALPAAVGEMSRAAEGYARSVAPELVREVVGELFG